MNFPERITVPVDLDMKEALIELASKQLDKDNKPMKLGAFCRQIFQIMVNINE